MNPMEKQKKKNTASKNMIYLVDDKKFLCQHNKLNQLIYRRENCILETMYRDVEQIIQYHSQKYITLEGRDFFLSNQTLNNCEIEGIEKKTISLGKLYILFKTLKINDGNREKCCGVSTDFLRRLTDFFFIIVGETGSTNIPLSKINRMRKSATLKCLYGPMYLELDDYSSYSDKR